MRLSFQCSADLIGRAPLLERFASFYNFLTVHCCGSQMGLGKHVLRAKIFKIPLWVFGGSVFYRQSAKLPRASQIVVRVISAELYRSFDKRLGTRAGLENGMLWTSRDEN